MRAQPPGGARNAGGGPAHFLRDCLFLVADKNMEGIFKGLLSRSHAHRALGCGPFAFDPKQDLIVAHGQNDPGLYTRANALLQPYARSHRHAVVVLDAAWEGSPGAASIVQRIQVHLTQAGWPEDAGCVVVITPELENWVWQDSPHVSQGLGFPGEYAQLRAELEAQAYWQTNAPKPHQPKEAVEWSLKRAKKPRSSAIYEQLANKVSTKHCIDPAFHTLLTALRRWFPKSPPEAQP